MRRSLCKNKKAQSSRGFPWLEAIVTQLEATRHNQMLANLLTPASGECLARVAAGHDLAECELNIPWLSPDVVIECEDVREFHEN